MRAGGLLFLVICFSLISDGVRALEHTVGPETRSKTILTIYGNGLALIRDFRTVNLSAGTQRIAFEGVSRSMIPASATVTAANGGVAVRELVYDFDVISENTLLRRYVGREVGIVRVHPTTGEETVEPATVIAIESGIVLQYRDRIETGVPGRIVFDDAPTDLRATPTLIAGLDVSTTTDNVELRYLSNGMNWSADYVVSLDDSASTLALNGRATLSNVTGIDFGDADVALIAGEVNRISPVSPAPEMAMARLSDVASAAPPAPGAPSRESFSDLHLYKIGAPISLADRQTKQIALVAVDGIAFQRTYIAERSAVNYSPIRHPATPMHPTVQLSFDNTDDGGLGEPLPAGSVRVYTTDSGGNVRLLGEDLIDAAPVGQTVDLSPGKAFDLSVTHRQSAFNRLSEDNRLTESEWEIKVENAKDEPTTVRIVERFTGDWEIVSENVEHEKSQADRAEWDITVPAKETSTLTYRVRVRR
jgi:hypothetical protein